MAAICGPELSRRAERFTLAVTTLAVLSAVVVPMLYLIALPVACGAAAMAAPSGRRSVTAFATWVPVSAAVFLGVAPI